MNEKIRLGSLLILCLCIVTLVTTTQVNAEVPGRLVYSSDATGDKEVYTMLPDGADIKRLTNNPATDEGAVWSPDGSKIAFKSDRNKTAGNDFDIYIMNADGSNVQPITSFHPSHERGLSFSPDGTRIAFASDKDGNFEIYTIKIDGTQLQRLTQNKFRDTTTHWSPDGNAIAFTTTRIIMGVENTEIFSVNINTLKETNLTAHKADDRIPAWSPNGTKIAFRSIRSGTDTEIVSMNSKGKKQTLLTKNNSNDLGPAWSPDGTKIAFSAERDGNSEIYIMNANGTNQVRITSTSANEDDIDW